jgi:hypothetical protein
MVLPQALKMTLWRAIPPWVRIFSRHKQIPALGSPTAGSEYDFVDESVLNGECYFYLLEDIYNSGISFFHGPVKATPKNQPDYSCPCITELCNYLARISFLPGQQNCRRALP